MSVRPSSKKCTLCSKRLPSSYTKPACKLCIAKIVKEESSDFMQDIKTLIRGEIQSALSNIPLSVTPSHSGQPPKKNPVCISDSKKFLTTKIICLTLKILMS